jgi:hypothetical protein
MKATGDYITVSAISQVFNMHVSIQTKTFYKPYILFVEKKLMAGIVGITNLYLFVSYS